MSFNGISSPSPIKKDEAKPPSPEDAVFTPGKVSYVPGEIQRGDTDVTSPMTTANSLADSWTPSEKSEDSWAEAVMCADEAHMVHQVREGFYVTMELEGLSNDCKKRFEKLAKRSILLQSDFEVRSKTELMMTDERSCCQVGIVLDQNGDERFVTCKHILVQKLISEEQIREFKSVKFYKPDTKQKYELKFPATEEKEEEDAAKHFLLRDGHKWKWGIDIAWGTSLKDFLQAGFAEAHIQDLRNSCFRHCERNDVYLGVRIGIAVYAPFTVDSKRAIKSKDFSDLTQARLDELYGPEQSVTIYTGEITFVGERHIEYTMNTFKGCSGAVLFILEDDNDTNTGDALDKWQPKAIGIHAGFEPNINSNVGFMFHPRQDSSLPDVNNDAPSAAE